MMMMTVVVIAIAAVVALMARDKRIAELEAELAALKGQPTQGHQ